MQKLVLNSVVFVFSLMLSFSSLAKTTDRFSRDEYINTWKEVAMENMIQFNIPASVTLAQGILESGDGNSELAKMSNNHFGIKCHSWKGDKVYYDDDAKGECFRKYDDAAASFADHSQFLLKKRYASLFELKITDYKGWARGLKKCGYATDPAYAKLLIGIIEKNELYKFDKEALKNKDEFLVSNDNDAKEAPAEIDSKPGEIPSTISLGSVRKIQVSTNRIKYVTAFEGDTIEKIATELEMPVFLVKKYNDADSSTEMLRTGEVVYLQPKRRKYKPKTHHIVKEGETMKEISQLYGIKLKVLYKKNNLKLGSEPTEGTKLSLKERVVV